MTYKFETINCLICGADQHQKISEKGKYNLPTNVVLCTNCGLGYLNPRWDRASYLHFYQREYDKFYRPDIRKKGGAQKRGPNPIIERFRQAELFPEQVKKILDIGSGAGENLFQLKSTFPESELFAIEPSVASREHLSRAGVKIVATDVDDSWQEGLTGHFDLIIMRHVLEHFLTPDVVLSKVRDVLSPDGIVYIAVPNNLSPTQALESSWFRNVHTYYFNKYSLRHLAAMIGLDIQHLAEGDDFNQGEVYLMAKKGEAAGALVFSNLAYAEQVKVFEEKMKQDKHLPTLLIARAKRVIGKVFS